MVAAGKWTGKDRNPGCQAQWPSVGTRLLDVSFVSLSLPFGSWGKSPEKSLEAVTRVLIWGTLSLLPRGNL